MSEHEEFIEPPFAQDLVGDRLRTAREQAGLEISDIAARTRIPMRHLQAIEVGDYTHIPSPTYVIGFVRSYARALGQNENEFVRDIRMEMGREPTSETYHSITHEPVDPKRVAPKWLAWGALIAALLIFGGYYLWRTYGLNFSAPPPAVDQQHNTGVMDNAASGPVNITDAGNAMVAGNAVVPAANAAVPVASTTGPVVLTATQQVWIRVYDSNKKTLYEKMMLAGESYTVPADAANPMIRTGSADKITVTVNGRSVSPLGTGQHIIKDVGVSAAALLARPAAAVPGAPAPIAPVAGSALPPPVQ